MRKVAHAHYYTKEAREMTRRSPGGVIWCARTESVGPEGRVVGELHLGVVEEPHLARGAEAIVQTGAARLRERLRKDVHHHVDERGVEAAERVIGIALDELSAYPWSAAFAAASAVQALMSQAAWVEKPSGSGRAIT